MNSRLNRVALANTLGALDLLLHPLFHLWVSVSPGSYEYLMNLFVAGLQLKVTRFDSDLRHIVLGTVIEAATLWLLGFTIGTLYNFFGRRSEGSSG